MKLMKRLPKTILAALVAIFAMPTIAPVQAQAALCLHHKEIVQQLSTKFKEKRRAFGLINSRRMMEVYVSKAGTWTMVVTTANKISCVVATGESWEQWKVKFGPTT